MVIVDDRKNYDEMIRLLEEVIFLEKNSAAALTAKLLIGRVETDRSEAEALGSYAKSKLAYEELTKEKPETWQGQCARIALLFILQNEEKHALVVSEGKKAIEEINWDLLGKNAPPDLADYKKISGIDAELTPDVMKLLLATSYAVLGKEKEAKEWTGKIENDKLKTESEEAIQLR